jgi:hypothetical protein
MVIICYTLSILLCFVLIINYNFFRSDAIHPVTVLSNQVDSKVDSQIVKENRASSVISAAGTYMLFFSNILCPVFMVNLNFS